MSVCHRVFRWTLPVVTLIAVLAAAAPAWAGTVQIQDDSHVLNATVVQNEAATLPVGIYIWATTQDAANKASFDTDVRNKVSPTFPIVIGINTESRHESIQIGSRAGLPQNAALAAESRANSAFVASMHSSNDYTAAVTAALGNLRTALADAHRRVPPAARASHSSGISFLWIILLLVGVVAVVLLLRRRGRFGARPRMASSPPPMGPYPGSYPGDYGPSYRSGMSPGAAGAIGAVGGGLLGYELGKMQGEEQQFRRDETMHDRDQYNSAGQGDWAVGQDSDFGGGDPGSGGGDTGGGDW